MGKPGKGKKVSPSSGNNEKGETVAGEMGEVWWEKAKPIANFSGSMLVARTLLDIKLASIYFSIKEKIAFCQGKFLEVGCGNQPYRFLLSKHAEYHGIDHAMAGEFASLRPDTKYYEGEVFPEQNGVYDWCFHTEVLEHVPNPDLFFRECHRVLKPTGQLLFTVPFCYRYHYIPHDYFRYTPSGLKMVLERNGFHITTLKPQGTDITVACYKGISVFFRFLTEKEPLPTRIIRALLTLVFLPLLALVHLVGMLSLVLDWGSSNDTLGYLVVAAKNDSPRGHGQ